MPALAARAAQRRADRRQQQFHQAMGRLSRTRVFQVGKVFQKRSLLVGFHVISTGWLKCGDFKSPQTASCQ